MENLHHAVAEVALDDDFAVLGGSADSTARLEDLAECRKVLLFSDESGNEGHLLASAVSPRMRG